MSGVPPPPPYNPNYPPPPQPNSGGFGAAPTSDAHYPGTPDNSGYGYGVGPPPPPVHVGYGYGAMPSGPAADGGDVESGQVKSSQFSFDNASIRKAFVRKVFTILTLQLAVVAGMIALFVYQKDCKKFVQGNPWIYGLSYATFLVTYIALMCCESVRRRFPGNMICLGVLTLAMGYLIAMLSSYYNADDVFIAAAITVFSCAAIAAFATQTKYDFTGCISVMIVLGFVLMFAGIIAVITAATTTHGKWINVVYCGLGAAFFMVWLAIDIQLVMGGKRMEISPEDYIYAATQLFLDIVYIFLYILQILGIARSNS